MFFLRKHIMLPLFYLIISHPMMAEDSTSDDLWLFPPIAKHLLTYVLIPFGFYYCAIIVRYYAKFLSPGDRPPLKEQLLAGIVFSVIAIAPLLPSIKLSVKAVDGTDWIAYILLMVVIMQEGLILHERAVSILRGLIDSTPKADNDSKSKADNE